MSDAEIRLAFAGTPDLAAVVLQALLDKTGYSVDHVYTQPDRPAGRGKRLKQSAVKTLSQHHKLDIFQPQTSAEIDPDHRLKQLDLLVVAAYGMILPEDILNRPRLGSINVHTSLLPRWRGAAPIQRAIEAGDIQTGITIMQMDAGLDTGDILLQRSCAIHEHETAGQLHDRLAECGADCLVESLDLLINQGVDPVKQDETKITYAHKITKEEARLDWSQPAIVIERQVRAFNPSPVAFTHLDNTRIKLWEVDAVDDPGQDNFLSGQVLEVTTDGIRVKSGKGSIMIRRFQLPGKKNLTVREYLNGNPGLFQNNPVFN